MRGQDRLRAASTPVNPTSTDAMPPPSRRTARLVRRITDAVLLALAVAGLLMFVGAPMFSGPQPWLVERSARGAPVAHPPVTQAADADRPAGPSPR